MTDTSDSRRILDLLAQGKITVDEADQLLRAVNSDAEPPDAPPPVNQSSAGSADAGEKASPKWLRMTIDKTRSDGRPRRQVNIRVPMSLLRGGIKLGAAMPHFASDAVVERLRARGIDIAELSKLDLKEFEAVLCDLGETTIDVDDGKAQIRFSSE